MSRQAHHVGDAAQALDLADTGYRTGLDGGSPSTAALPAAMQGRAQALRGDQRACAEACAVAERPWIRRFRGRACLDPVLHHRAAVGRGVDQVGVEHGIARTPEVLLLGDEKFPRQFLDLVFEVYRGGTQTLTDRSTTTVRVPTRMVPAGPPTLPWRRVEQVVYDHPVGLVDPRQRTATRRVDATSHPGRPELPRVPVGRSFVIVALSRSAVQGVDADRGDCPHPTSLSGRPG